MSENVVDIDISKKDPYTNVKITTDNKPTTKDGTVLYGYHKRTYTPNAGYKVNKIKKGNSYFSGFNKLSQDSSVSIFYWTGKENQIFIIQLGDGDDYYYTNDNTKWEKHPNINSHNLLKELDEWNCTRNSLHVANISQRIPNSRGAYNCPSCGSPRRIDISFDMSKKSEHHYTRYRHSIPGGKFGNVMNGTDTILSVPDGVDSLYVYWSTGANATPRLLYYSVRNSHKWFSIYHGDTVWSEESALTQDPQTEDPNKIQKIVQGFYIPKVVIDLSKNTQYQPTGNTLEFKVEVTENPEHSGHYEYKHSKMDKGTFRVKDVIHGTRPLDGLKSFDPIVSVSAYYLWDKPVYDNLIFVQLGEKDNHYTWTSDYSWSPYSESASDLTNFKKEVCRRKGHILDISKVSETYLCSGCSQTIEVASAESIDKYKQRRYAHYIGKSSERTPFSVSYFVNSNAPQKNLPSAKDISKIYVFWYPIDQDYKPLLIFYNLNKSTDDKWYIRKDDGNGWEEVLETEKKPSYENNYQKIEDLLKNISIAPGTSIPYVVINLKETNTGTEFDGGKGEYSDPSGNKIQVVAEKVEAYKGETGEQGATQEITEYKKYIHKVKGKTRFRLGSLKHGGSTYDEITSNDILGELAAYYWTGDTVLGKPLVVMLKVETPKTEYIYYGRSNDPGKTWQKIDREQKKGQVMEQQELKKLLDKLKEEYFPPSKIKEIVGGSVGGILGTGALGFGGYKLWPVLTTLF